MQMKTTELMRQVRRCGVVLLVASGLVHVCPPSRAAASPLFELVGSNLGNGGFNARATGASAASAYFNPALLPQAKAGLEVGLMLLNDAISIGLDGRSSAQDVPLDNIATRREGEYPIPTIWLEDGCLSQEQPERMCLTDIPQQPRQSAGSSGNTRAYQVIGLVTHLIEDRWSFGLYTTVPMDALLSAHSYFPDEREQYFSNSLHSELHSDRLTPMSLAFGTGVRVMPWLSLGASFTLNLANVADARTYVGNSANLQKTLLLSTEVDSKIGMAPHFSAVVEPTDTLDLSLSIHTPQKLDITAGSGTFLANGDSQSATRKNVHGYVPMVVGVGAVYEFYRMGGHVLSVAGTGLFKRWSRYENRQGERPLPGYEWSDTLSGVLGVRYVQDERFAAYLDLSYDPTPIPLQTGRTNYVGNDDFATSLGASYTLPVESWGLRFRFGVQAQAHLLRERHQSKLDPKVVGDDPSLVVDEWPDQVTDIDGNPIAAAQGLQTNNPGWPGFTSKGTLLGGALTVGILF